MILNHELRLASNLTLTLTLHLQGNITTKLSNSYYLGAGEVSKALRQQEMCKGLYDPSLTSNLTLTLQLQGHIAIGLSSSDYLGVGAVSRLLKPLEFK